MAKAEIGSSSPFVDMAVSILSNYSFWIDERGYNFGRPNGFFFPLAEVKVSDGSLGNAVFFQENAFSVFPALPEGEITGGTLQILPGSYNSPESAMTVLIYAMDTPADQLVVTGGDLRPSIFSDAGSGILLGSYVQGPVSDLLPVDITLTPEGIEWLNNLPRGEPFAIGYTVADPPINQSWGITIYADGGISPALNLNVVPEASPGVLLSFAIACFGLMRRRRA